MKMQAGVWGRWAEWAGSRENPGPRSLCFLNRDVELWASPMVQWVKNPPAVKETWVWFLDWEDPWKSTWQLTPEFLPGKPCGQRSLSSYCPWGPKESGMTAVTEHKPNCGLFALVVIYDLHDVRSGGSHHHNHSCCGATWAISRNKLDPDFSGAWEGLLKCFLLDSLCWGWKLAGCFFLFWAISRNKPDPDFSGAWEGLLKWRAFCWTLSLLGMETCWLFLSFLSRTTCSFTCSFTTTCSFPVVLVVLLELSSSSTTCSFLVVLSHLGLSKHPLSRLWCGFDTHDPSSEGRLRTAEIVWSGL